MIRRFPFIPFLTSPPADASSFMPSRPGLPIPELRPSLFREGGCNKSIKLPKNFYNPPVVYGNGIPGKIGRIFAHFKSDRLKPLFCNSQVP